MTTLPITKLQEIVYQAVDNKFKISDVKAEIKKNWCTEDPTYYFSFIIHEPYTCIDRMLIERNLRDLLVQQGDYHYPYLTVTTFLAKSGLKDEI